LDALDRGARDFILCIGGSATTDGGCGMAAGLGVKFLDEQGIGFVPCGQTLVDIAVIDMGSIDKRIAQSSFTVMCDVDNPLFGPRGAAHIFGPQKGANPGQVFLLDKGLRHLGQALNMQFGKDFANIPGAGAAGGLGAGCMAFLDATLMSGIDAILKLCGFEKHLLDADLIITGEGRLDSQSFYGKVLSGILSKAGAVPVWSICGVCECDDDVLSKNNVVVFETSKGITIQESMSNAEKYLGVAAHAAMQHYCSRIAIAAHK